MKMSLLAGLLVCALARIAAGVSIELVNNHPFDIRMPVQLRDDLTVIAEVPPSSTRRIESDASDAKPALQATPDANGLKIADLGTLTWDVIVQPAQADRGAEPPSTKRDFDKLFHPLALKFDRTAQSPLFDTFS